MKIAIGSDHRGFILKEEVIKYLSNHQINYEDCGTYSAEKTDYPQIAKKVALSIQEKKCDVGILICGTGIGMSVAANKFKGIRCANCYNIETAKYAKMHNNANIIALGAGQVAKEEALQMVEVWLNTEFEGQRHQNRIDMISNIENENMK